MGSLDFCPDSSLPEPTRRTSTSKHPADTFATNAGYTSHKGLRYVWQGFLVRPGSEPLSRTGLGESYRMPGSKPLPDVLRGHILLKSAESGHAELETYGEGVEQGEGTIHRRTGKCLKPHQAGRSIGPGHVLARAANRTPSSRLKDTSVRQPRRRQVPPPAHEMKLVVVEPSSSLAAKCDLDGTINDKRLMLHIHTTGSMFGKKLEGPMASVMG